MIIQEITTTEALESLRLEWTELIERCPRATPFHTPEWLLPWWKQFGRGKLWTLALRNEQHLAGLVPLFIDAPDPAMRHTQMLPLGAGITDYTDFLLAGTSAIEAAEAVFRRLAARHWLWGECDFGGLRETCFLFSAAVVRSQRAAAEPSLLLSLPATDQEFLSGLSPTERHKLEQAARYSKNHGLSIAAASKHNDEDHSEHIGEHHLQLLLSVLFRLHEARWREKGTLGVLHEPSVQNFHRQAACTLLALGRLRLYALWFREKIIGVWYGFAMGETVYYYLSGYDPDYKRFSPGNLMVRHAIGRAIQEGFRYFDFLRGREAYKYAWGAQERPNYRLVVNRENYFRPGWIRPDRAA